MRRDRETLNALLKRMDRALRHYDDGTVVDEGTALMGAVNTACPDAYGAAYGGALLTLG